MANDLMTVETLCQKLKVSENTAYQLLKTGQLKGFKIGRIWRIPQSNLDSYILSRTGNNKGEDSNEHLSITR